MLTRKAVVTAVVLSATLVAMGGWSANAKAVKLEIWDWYPARYELWKAKAAEYEKLNPGVTIKASVTDWATYWSKVAASVASNNAPDLFAFHNSWTGMFLKLIEPYPENLFPIRTMRSDYALFNQAFAFGNKFYFYPQGLMTSLMFYNKTLWAEAGLAATPKTWDEFRLAAKKLTRKTAAGKFDKSGFDITPWQAGLLWSDLRYQSGKWLYSEDGKRVEWDDASGRKITNQLFDMTVRDGSTPSFGRDTAPAFESGKVGISYQWTFMQSAYMKFPKLKYGTFLIPTDDGLDTPARGRNNFEVGFAVPANIKASRKQEAFKFIKWLYSDERFYLALNDMLGTIPAKKSFWSRPAIREDIVQANVAKQAPYTVFPGEFPSWMYNEVIPDMATRLMQSKLSPEQALKRAAEAANIRLKTLPARWVVERRYKAGEAL